MKKFIVIFIFLGIYASLLSGQINESDYETFDDAEFFFSTEEYEEALYLFQELNRKYPDNHNINFRVGMSYLNIPGRETKAIPYLEKAVESVSLKYKARDPKIEKAPHHAWFYLGNAYRINNQLDKALECYSEFQDIRKFEKHYNVRIVENEVQASERAKIITDNPLNLLKTNAGEQINTGQKATFPVVNNDESFMVFLREEKFYNALMYTERTDEGWTIPVNITPQVGSDGDMIPASMSNDGKNLLLVRRTNSSNGDIYISKKEGEFWSKAVKLGKNINTLKDEAHASFSPSGDFILFSSSRRGGYGGLDIYISYKEVDNTWGKAINLGPVINTGYDESSAFILKDKNTLYFTSKGHFNMGGYDIFYSEKDTWGKWTDPVNIGFPLNTTSNNSFFQPVKDGKTGYISLFAQENNFGEEDIYKVEILPVQSPVIPEQLLFNQDFILYLENEENGEIIEIEYNRKDNDLKIKSNSDSDFKWKFRKQ